MSTRTPFLSALTASLCLTACGEAQESPPRTPSPNPGAPVPEAFRPTHRVVQASPFYRSGPQQGRPPDGTLEIGTEVQHVGDGGSHLRVRFRDGTEASVSTGSLEAIK